MCSCVRAINMIVHERNCTSMSSFLHLAKFCAFVCMYSIQHNDAVDDGSTILCTLQARRDGKSGVEGANRKRLLKSNR